MKISIGSYNSVGHNHSTRAASAPVLRTLPAFRSLQSLDVYKWGFDAQEMQALCDALRQSETLKSVTLANENYFDPEALDTLCRFLRNDSYLTYLSLRNFRLREDECLKLCNALMQGPSMKHVNLSYTRICDNGMKHIADLVAGNQHVEELELLGVSVGDEGLIYMGDALHRNRVLKTLYYQGDCVNYEHVSEKGIKALLDGHRSHRKLILHFDLETMSQSRKDEMKFCNVLNRTFCSLFNADPPVPLGLWPNALHRASLSPNNLNTVYFVVKEKCDLFQCVPTSDATGGKRKCRGRGNGGAKERKRQRY